MLNNFPVGGAPRARAIVRSILCSVLTFPVLYMAGMGAGIREPARILVVLPAALLVGGLMHLFIEALGDGTATAVRRMVGYSSGGGERIPFEYSQLQAMVERGEVDAALRAFEAALVERPDDAALHLRVADICAGHAAQPARAEALFRTGRALWAEGDDAGSPAARDATIYATQRLIDLYEEALDDRGRALVELRRLIETFPGSREATAAAGILARWKYEHRMAELQRPVPRDRDN